MKKRTRICDEDCLNCPYPDCVKSEGSGYNREYYLANRERICERNRKRYWADVEKSRAYQREWYRKRKEAQSGNHTGDQTGGV